MGTGLQRLQRLSAAPSGGQPASHARGSTRKARRFRLRVHHLFIPVLMLVVAFLCFANPVRGRWLLGLCWEFFHYISLQGIGDYLPNSKRSMQVCSVGSLRNNLR